MAYLIAGVYGVALSFLFVYGLNILYLTYLAHYRDDTNQAPPPLQDLPIVTVQLPIYNEQYVAKRLIEAVSQLDWPADKLEIQVLDDSTDQTTSIVATQVQHYQGRGLQIHHLRRRHRIGYKAGALAEGLQQAKGEFIAIFDADFVPPSDFLRRTIPPFDNPHIGFVQTRWGHLNADYSLFTKLQSLAIDAHFMIEQFARHRAGFFMNFNGTAGVWRRTAIESAGGWQANTLTEDLDLSYRAMLAGWQAGYLREVVTPGEIPVTLSGFRQQQHRWAKGSITCAKRFLPIVWGSPLAFTTKLQATLHLTGYAVQLLMSMVALLYPAVLLLDLQAVGPLFSLTTIFTLTFFAPTLYFLTAQRQAGNGCWRRLPLVLCLNVLGTGMMYHNAYSVLAGLGSTKADMFQRTPKFGIVEKRQSWNEKIYQTDSHLFFEIIMLFYNLHTTYLAITHESWSIAFYAGLFTLGSLFMLVLWFTQGLERWQFIRRMALQEGH